MEKSKKNEVYRSIRRAIISGELKQGEMINEGELAELYSVSRTPVREALLMLTFEGLVNSLPRAGYMVTQITIRDVQEAFHLRELLEVEAVRLATEQITATDIEVLEEKKVGIPPEINPVFNREFHLIIAHASGSQRLAELIERLLDEMERILVYDPHISGPHGPEEHELIIKALRERDADMAQEAMREHIHQVKSRVLKRF